MTSVSTARVAEIFVEVADTSAGALDPVDFLYRLTTSASELAGGRSAGLLLVDHLGKLQFMAGSDDRVELLELLQVDAQEGPCFDCFQQGDTVVEAQLAHATHRWPRFAPRAVGAGFRSVHAFPLRSRHQVIGALNLFGDDAGGVDVEDVPVVQALADLATLGLLQERVIARSEARIQQLEGALTSRIVIEQAKGRIAQLHGCSPDEAFRLLRTHCRNNGLRLGDVAATIATDHNHAGAIEGLNERDGRRSHSDRRPSGVQRITG